MNARGLGRYVDDLLGGRRPRPFHPDDFEAAQIRTAIDLQAARPGSDAPRPEYLSGWHSHLAAQIDGAPPSGAPTSTRGSTRRHVLVGTSAAAAAAAVSVTADRLVLRGERPAATDDDAAPGGELTPTHGTWQRVASSTDVVDTGMHPFEVGSVTGFVRRVD